jgi:hypothetical protein
MLNDVEDEPVTAYGENAAWYGEFPELLEVLIGCTYFRRAT